MSQIPAHIREDIYNIKDEHLESISSNIFDTHDQNTSYLPERVYGSDELLQKLDSTLHKYKHRFNSEVQAEPAYLTPFDLTVDKSKWENPNNRWPPRRADSTTQKMIRDKVQLLQDHQIIRTSKEPYYSHAFVLPKPNEEWRFVVDYKNLNDITKMER